MIVNTGYVRAAVVPEIQASPREVGLLLTSARSGPLDQDSTVILPVAGPLFPHRRTSNPYSETLPMSDNWTDDLITSTPVLVQQTLQPNHGTTLNHQPALTPANGPACNTNSNQAHTFETS